MTGRRNRREGRATVVWWYVLYVGGALALLLLVQCVMRPRLGRRGRMVTDAALGDPTARWRLRRETDHAVLRRLYPGLYAPGGPLLKRRATKHLAMLGRTLVVRADADRVDPWVRQVVAAQTDFEEVPAAADETTAWRWSGSLVGALPRMSARRSTAVPGSVEIGVTDYGWGLGFPQGGPIAARFTDAMVMVLQQQRVPYREYLRGFVPTADVRTDLGDRDGVWHVDALLPADATPTADLGDPA